MQTKLTRCAEYFVAGIFLIVALQMIGLIFNIGFLSSPIAGIEPMNVVAAIGFIMAAASLRLRIAKNSVRFSTIASNVLAVLFMFATCWRTSSYAFKNYVNIPIFYARDSISSNATFCFLLTGVILVSGIRQSARRIAFTQYIAVTIFLIAIFSIFINSYHAESFKGIFAVPMSPYLAMCFLLFSLAVLFANPDKGLMKVLTTPYAGSIMAQRLIPAAIVLPFIFGLMNLYFRTTGIYSTAFGAAMSVLAVTTTCMIFIIYSAKMLNKRDAINEKLNASLEQKVAERTDEINQLTSELRALLNHVQTSREEERKYIAREIHDELGSSLTAIKIDVSMMHRKVNFKIANINETSVCKLPTADCQLAYISSELQTVISNLDKTINSVKNIATALRPEILDHLDIIEAVKWQAQQFTNITGAPCTVSHLPEFMNLQKTVSTAVYRTVQEALTNIARHANASSVKILIEQDSKNVLIEVKDNGKGIREEQLKSAKSLGLIGMRERVHLLNGTFAITGEAGKGTVLTVNIPINTIKN